MQVRQSDLKQFGACARQYFYSKVLDLGEGEQGSLTVLGTVFHYAIEVYENYDHDLSLAHRTFTYYWENPGELGEKIDFWHRSTNYMSLLNRGLDMLTRYHELAPWKKGALVGTEIKYSVPLGRHTLNGTIDKLFVRRGQRALEIIDFKTGALVPEKLRYNLQFTAYAYATMRPEFWSYVPGFEDGHLKYAGYARTGWWYHARNNKMFSAGEREAVDYKRLLLAVDELETAIEKNVYPLDIKGENCGYCPFVHEICGAEKDDPVMMGRT